MFLQQVRRLQALLHRCEEFASNPEILEPTVELDEVNTSGGEDCSPFKYPWTSELFTNKVFEFSTSHRLVRLKFAAFFSLFLGGGWFVHLAWEKVEA